MTALNFILEKDAVCIAMDTLATCGDDKSPQSFASKMFPVPHLNGVICGTGIFEFVGKWFLFVNSAFVVKNMIHLDQYAPKELRKLYAEVWKDADLPKASSTIYHFGYDERLKEFVGFAYRSESNFESEILKTNHAGYKPPPSMLVNGDNPELECLPDSFIKIMTVQKKKTRSGRLKKGSASAETFISCICVKTRNPKMDFPF